MPISLQVRITLRAISPLLAISIFLNTVFEIGETKGLTRRIYQEQWLIIFYWLSIVNQNFYNSAGNF